MERTPAAAVVEQFLHETDGAGGVVLAVLVLVLVLVGEGGGGTPRQLSQRFRLLLPPNPVAITGHPLR